MSKADKNIEATESVEVKESEKKAPPAFILGKRPTTISATVPIPMADGTVEKIEVAFVYRTRTEMGEFQDRCIEDAIQASQLKDGEQFSNAAMAKAMNAINAQQALQYIESWKLDIELTKETLEQLFDECAGASSALWEAYRNAIQEGRRGN